MQRQSIDGGKWFDLEKAELFKEDTAWDGNNNISKATRSQWDHEWLYRTATNNWVLNCWSDRQGSRETWSQISDTEAATWLIQNDHDHPDVQAEIEALEI